jgi:O-antigen/teichoic acid export membrane protein
MKRSILINFFSKLWTLGVGFIFVPIYIKYIGVEGYGMMGFFFILQTVVSIFSVGSTTTFTREVSRNFYLKENNAYLKNVSRTFEILFIVISILIVFALVIFSFFLSKYWINPNSFSLTRAFNSFILMSLISGIQTISGFYDSGLMGMQKISICASVNVGSASIKALGSVFVLVFISPTIEAFLIWQLLLSLLTLPVLSSYFWKYISPLSQTPPLFKKEIVRQHFVFTAGITLNIILALIYSQFDKIILSKVLSLKDFGYYSLASTVASLINTLSYVAVQPVIPRINELIVQGKTNEYNALFHKATLILAIIVFPITLTFHLFSNDLIYLWTQSYDIALQSGPILRFLILSTAINALTIIPLQYAYAFGWVRFGSINMLVSIILMLPLISYTAIKFGAIASAKSWFWFSIPLLILSMLFLFSRVLKDQKIVWFKKSLIYPLITTITIGYVFSFLKKKYIIFEKVGIIAFSGFCFAICLIALIIILNKKSLEVKFKINTY